MAKQPTVKAGARKNKQLSVSMFLILDLFSLFFSLMPSVIAFSLTGLFIAYGYAHTWWVLPLAPLVLFPSFILIIALIRLCLPKLKPGRYKRELNKTMVAWFCHFALARAAKVVGLIPILQSFNTLKFCYWRALGAKVSFQIMSSYDIDFVDCPLITIKKGVTLASQVSVSCHSDVGSLLFLAPVVIEEDAFIGMATVIGPGTTIKRGAWIGYGNAFVNQVVEENAKFESVRPGIDGAS